MPGQEVTDLLMQAANAAQAETADSTLGPAERMALRYFARANRFSRTESALAEFQSIGLSRAAQLVGSLLSGGYLVRQPANDRGETRLALTDATQALLADDPYAQLLRAVDTLEPDKKAVLCQALRRVLNALVEDSAHWYLNSCRHCSELVWPDGSPTETGPGRCKVFNIEVLAEEMGSLCIDFSPLPKTGKGTDH